METLNFNYSLGRKEYGTESSLVGVVSSSNLEVLIEKSDDDICKCEVITSEAGYKDIWEAVVGDFFLKYEVKGINIYINDNGASPSVVSLRLDQAMEKFKGNNYD